MNTPFGLRGTIMPTDAFQGHVESISSGPFSISVENGVLEIGFDDEALADQARLTVSRYLSAVSLNCGRRLSAQLNQSWRKNPAGGKDIGLSLSDQVPVSDALQMTTTAVSQTATARIVKAFNSRDLSNSSDLASKCDKDPALASALDYLNEEVIDDDRPLYGVYKALEALTETFARDGRTQLAKLAGQDKKYVGDVMETAQTTRHHNDPDARSLLTEDECKHRATVLLLAYAKSIK
jgi:hypothetical protein